MCEEKINEFTNSSFTFNNSNNRYWLYCLGKKVLQRNRN